MKKILFIIFLIAAFPTPAQEDKMSVVFYDGVFIGGYVNNGAFLNFTGPNISLTHKNSKFIFGMLPSLRFKEDKDTPKNTFVTPNLGIGFTYSYKMWAVQLPLYYNSKTATLNGNWQVGFGVGLRLN